MPRNYLFSGFVLIVVCGLINLGTVRKKDNPIIKTQTDPIKYEHKMKEVEEGEKGAPVPSFKYYEDEEQMSNPPVEAGDGTGDEMEDAGEAPLFSQAEEDFPEDEADEGVSEDWWFEEWDDNLFKETAENDVSSK